MFLTRNSLVERNESLQRDDWTRAQKDADFYGNITWGTLGLSSGALLGAGIWWYLNQKTPSPTRRSYTQPMVQGFTF